MMVGIKLGEVAGAARRLGFIAVAMVLNYLLSPLAAAGLARVFLGSHPDFAVGLILAGVVPCAGMIVAWTGMAGGNMSLALVITVLSLMAGIVLIPVWMLALAEEKSHTERQTRIIDRSATLKPVALSCALLNDEQGRVTGCGWGGLARYAAERFGCTVTAVNISRGQLHYARKFCNGLRRQFPKGVAAPANAVR